MLYLPMHPPPPSAPLFTSHTPTTMARTSVVQCSVQYAARGQKEGILIWFNRPALFAHGGGEGALASRLINLSYCNYSAVLNIPEWFLFFFCSVFPSFRPCDSQSMPAQHPSLNLMVLKHFITQLTQGDGGGGWEREGCGREQIGKPFGFLSTCSLSCCFPASLGR